MTRASEVRLDPWSGDEVILAPGRLSIGGSKPGGLPAPSGRCPFCPGHEADAEATIAEVGEPWQTRVVGNRFPLVAPSMPLARGAHEVIIETREHDVDLPDLDLAAITRVLGVYRDRVRALSEIEGVRAVVLFRNRGRRAGSSQPHPHAQIVALDYVPPALRRCEARMLAHPALHERALDADRRGGRIVIERHDLVTFCPFASSRAYEVRIAPTDASMTFRNLPDASIAELASHLMQALRGLRRIMGLSDYNLLVREPSRRAEGVPFSMVLLPRTGGDAGFELHTGSSICLVAPEETAAALRKLDASA